MSPFSSFLKKPERTGYQGIDQDEEVLYIVRKSTLTTIPWIFTFILLVIAPFVIGPILSKIKIGEKSLFGLGILSTTILFWYLTSFGYFLQNLLHWFFNALIITNKKIIDLDFHGINFRNVSETTLYNVEDVTSTVAGTLGTIFNIGNVHIQTAGEKSEFEFYSVQDPSQVRDIISDLVGTKRPYGNN